MLARAGRTVECRTPQRFVNLTSYLAYLFMSFSTILFSASSRLFAKMESSAIRLYPSSSKGMRTSTGDNNNDVTRHNNNVMDEIAATHGLGMPSDTAEHHGDLPLLGKPLRQEHFCWRENLICVNNGSFGAVPKSVLASKISYILEMESNPDAWYRKKTIPLYESTIQNVADFVGAEATNVVLVENVTTGMNCILKSFPFQKRDAILGTNQAYRANESLTNFLVETAGLNKVTVDIPWESTKQEVLAKFRAALEASPNIKLAIVEHIACFSTMMMPIAEIINLFREYGVLLAVDGAHGPGQLPLNLEELGADFYLSNLNKWVFAPKGCGMMYVHPNHHSWIRPVVAAWRIFHQDLRQRFYFPGTYDYSSFFSISDAISFYRGLGGLDRIGDYNQKLTDWAADMLAEAWNAERVVLAPELRSPFMCLLRLPSTVELEKYDGPNGMSDVFKDLADVDVSARVILTNKNRYLRLGSHVYNCEEDYTRLRDVMGKKLGLLA